MKIHLCQQGSDEWRALRLGIPTASEFHRIVDSTGRMSRAKADKTQPAEKVRAYMRDLCVEWLLGCPVDGGSSGWMARGKEHEDRAIEYYEFVSGNTVQRVGFVANDAGTYGCSPDFFIDDFRGGEVKILSAANHLAVLLGDVDDYKAQVQGCMLVCERSAWDRVWWHPTWPSVVLGVEQDGEYVANLAEALAEFTGHLAEMKTALLEKGCVPCVEREASHAAERAAEHAEFDRLSAEEASRQAALIVTS